MERQNSLLARLFASSRTYWNMQMLFPVDLDAGVVRTQEPRLSGRGRRTNPLFTGKHSDLRHQGLHR